MEGDDSDSRMDLSAHAYEARSHMAEFQHAEMSSELRVQCVIELLQQADAAIKTLEWVDMDTNETLLEMMLHLRKTLASLLSEHVSDER